MNMWKKIVTLLLVAVLTVGLFSACVKEDGPVWEWDKLTKEFLAEMKKTAPSMDEYYGTYNGWIVYGRYRSGADAVSVPITGDIYSVINLSSGTKWTDEVAGYYFLNWPQIFVYRDGVYYRLKEAYEEHQILSKEQIGYIYAYHRELYPAAYEKKDELTATRSEWW